VGSFEEGMHSIKTKKLPTAVINLDLGKAYDKVN
jgi:hypothetical protein